MAAVIKQHYLKATPEDRKQYFDRTVHSYYHIYAESILHAYVRASYLRTAQKDPYSSALLYDNFYQKICIKPFFQCYGKFFFKFLETEKVLYRIRGDSGITCEGTYEDKDIRKPSRCKTQDGRVNLAGDPVLYLAESLEACVNEVFKDETKKPSCILVGEFKPEKPLALIDIEELIKVRPDPARWIDQSLESDCSIQDSSEAELCEMCMYIFMQEYNNLIHISASGAEEITYQRSAFDAKFLVDVYQKNLGIEEVHGLVWNSRRSAETTKSYAFFNGDATEFKVDKVYIAKLSGTGNYEALKY